MIQDDHSGYVRLYSTTNTTAETVAHAFLDWCATFTIPKSFMSNGPTHFRNETIRLLVKGLRTKHHFTLPYFTWSNGAVERVGRAILRVYHAVLSELHLRPNEWADLVPIFQSALNHAPSPQLHSIPPITELTGMAPQPPFATFMSGRTAKPITLTELQRERSFNITKLQ